MQEVPTTLPDYVSHVLTHLRLQPTNVRQQEQVLISLKHLQRETSCLHTVTQTINRADCKGVN